MGIQQFFAPTPYATVVIITTLCLFLVLALDACFLIYTYACPYSLAEQPARQADLANVVLPL
jgi:hypothetical protein